MGVVISSRVLGDIVAVARSSPGVEICGLMFGDADRIDDATGCTNVAADPATTFEIDPAALFAAHRRARAGGPVVIGHYHSHPTGNPAPSPRDAAQAMGDGALWLIVGAGTARLWRSTAPGVFVEETLVER